MVKILVKLEVSKQKFICKVFESRKPCKEPTARCLTVRPHIVAKKDDDLYFKETRVFV